MTVVVWQFVKGCALVAKGDEFRDYFSEDSFHFNASDSKTFFFNLSQYLHARAFFWEVAFTDFSFSRWLVDNSGTFPSQDFMHVVVTV